MDTCISRRIRADPDLVFELAAHVEDWPRLLPHYRWVRVLARNEAAVLVEMAARRPVIGGLSVPLWWRAVATVDRARRRIGFEHVAGITRGMRVEWRLEPLIDQPVNEPPALVDSPVNQRSSLVDRSVNQPLTLTGESVDQHTTLVDESVNQPTGLVDESVNQPTGLIEPSFNAVEVSIRHLFQPPWPAPDWLITTIVGDYFVNGVARRTLHCLALHAELERKVA